MSNTLYERDFHAWANQQAALLRAGQLSDADIENIAEEIESIGRTQRSELVNRLIVLLVHLMKWRWQPGLRGASWRLIVKEQRRALRRHLRDNPSLKPFLDAAIRDAYDSAQVAAEREIGLAAETFPDLCPFTFDQALSDDFWPD